MSVLTSASFRRAKFVRELVSGEDCSGLGSLEAGRVQTPVSGSQTWSVIVIDAWETG